MCNEDKKKAGQQTQAIVKGGIPRKKMFGFLDQQRVIKDGVIQIEGWRLGVSAQDGKAYKVQICVQDEQGGSIAADRKDVVRWDVNKIYLSKADLNFESGYQVQWHTGGKRKFKVIFHFEDLEETVRIDVAMLEILEREKLRRYKNWFDMLFHKDKDLLKDNLYLLKKGKWKTYLKYAKNRYMLTDPVYAEYFQKHRAGENELKGQRAWKFDFMPKISVVVPTYHTPKKYLVDMIESVVRQSYPNWELCIADGSEGNQELEGILQRYHEKDKRIVYRINEKNLGIAGNTNAALSLATGEYIALLDHDDILAPEALFEVVKVMNEREEADVIYTDEDKITNNIRDHFGPTFKPDLNMDFLRSNNYICHFFVARKKIVDEIKGFRSDFDGSQDYDFIFRCVEKARNVYHVPKVLYYWRCHPDSVAGNPESKLYAYEAGKRAIEEHLRRMGEEKAVVERLSYWGLYRVTYPVKENSLVSIIIHNRDHAAELRKCLEAVRSKTSYPNYEIVIIENNSKQKEIFEYYRELEKLEYVRVLQWDGEPNDSGMNNYGAENSNGDYLLFLGNCTEVITENWLELMLGSCQRKDVGVVGAKLYEEDDTIRHAGTVLGLDGIAASVMQGEPKAMPGYCGRAIVQQNYSAVTAACMMISKKMFERVGGFDEKFKEAYYDVDLCLAVGREKRQIVFDPNIELFYHGLSGEEPEDMPKQMGCFQKEGVYLREKWNDLLKKEDPCYNCNFSLESPGYLLKTQ